MNQKVTIRPPRQRASRSRTALTGALLSLLEEQSYEQITIREITTRAQIGYATFFRNYLDKDALLHDLAAGEISKLLAMTLPIFYTVDSEASTRALCAYVWEHRKLWTGLLTGGAAAELKKEYLQQALHLLEEPGQPTSWLPGDLAVTFAVTAIVEILAWWLKQLEPPAVKEMAEVLNRLTVLPIMPKTTSTTQDAIGGKEFVKIEVTEGKP
jgi:AcrR family transcriptional regulator